MWKWIYGEKKEGKYFKNCTCQQVNKSKNTADKQHTLIVAAIDSICKKQHKSYISPQNSNLITFDDFF